MVKQDLANIFRKSYFMARKSVANTLSPTFTGQTSNGVNAGTLTIFLLDFLLEFS